MNLGPNQALIGEADALADLCTPALLLDRLAFEHNLKLMADLARQHGRHLRPHFKAHKCLAIARRQVDAGAIGLCCATVREAEILADATMPGILLTSVTTAPSMIKRLARVHEKAPDLTIACDSEIGIDALRATFSPSAPIGVVIDLDVGQGRTGVLDVQEALRLAKTAAMSPQLWFRGVQAYYGQAQHVGSFAERQKLITAQWQRITLFVDALRSAGLDPEIITGGGTGTHQLDLNMSPFNELQVGSYLFMDQSYQEVALTTDNRTLFLPALHIASRVVSASRPGHVVIDAGLKALPSDSGRPLPVGIAGQAHYRFLGDEHGGLAFDAAVQPPALGTLIKLLVPHCDPTINLHDRLHVLEGRRLADVWPIDARGY